MSLTGLGGVILAAGESSRMGRDKALLPWPPEVAAGPASGTILSAAIEALSEVCDFVLVVTGKNESVLRPIVYSMGGFLVSNLAPERGQFSSFQTGLQEVLNRGRDCAMVTLVDRPPPKPETIKRLVKAFVERNHATWLIVPEYQGRHGHPIVMGREMIQIFQAAPVTANAQEIEHSHPQRIDYVAVDDPLVARNVDTPQDYESLQSIQLNN
jgi:molybdenum cofactor cytidylyltransferase